MIETIWIQIIVFINLKVGLKFHHKLIYPSQNSSAIAATQPRTLRRRAETRSAQQEQKEITRNSQTM